MPNNLAIQLAPHQLAGHIASLCGNPRIWGVGSSVEEATLNCINTHPTEFGLTQKDLIESSADNGGYRLGSRAALLKTITLMAERGSVLKTYFSVVV
jgi:hypothetical protein